jgi:hypothetical protein
MIVAMNLDSRLFSLAIRDDLIASLCEKPKKFMGSMQLWEMDSYPVSIAPDGEARIFYGAEWKGVDGWELLSEGTPLSFFLFNLRWPQLITEDEYLLSYRDASLNQSSIESELNDILMSGNSAIMWLLAEYDGTERLEVYEQFKAPLEKYAILLQQKKAEGEREGHPLVVGWGGKFMKQRGAGALALLHLQLKICIELDRRPIRLSSLVEVVHHLLTETRNTFNERLRVESDILIAGDRGRIRQEWNEFTYRTSRNVSAEAVSILQEDELQVLAGFDHLVYSKFLERANKEFAVYQRRIRKLHFLTKVKSAFGLARHTQER